MKNFSRKKKKKAHAQMVSAVNLTNIFKVELIQSFTSSSKKIDAEETLPIHSKRLVFPQSQSQT